MSDSSGDPTQAPRDALPLRDEDLEPVRRDPRFLLRLVAAIALGLVLAVWVGARARAAAAACGAGMIRPGVSVIPAEEPGADGGTRR